MFFSFCSLFGAEIRQVPPTSDAVAGQLGQLLSGEVAHFPFLSTRRHWLVLLISIEIPFSVQSELNTDFQQFLSDD